MQILFGVFLIAHGLVHALYTSPRPPDAGDTWPFDLDHSWLLGGAGTALRRGIGKVLWVTALAGFVLTGLGVSGVPLLADMWRTLAIVSAGVSLLLMLIFWHRWLTFGVLIDLAILAVVWWLGWPPGSR
jgi:hypothetical protein